MSIFCLTGLNRIDCIDYGMGCDGMLDNARCLIIIIIIFGFHNLTSTGVLRYYNLLRAASRALLAGVECVDGC